MIPAKQFKRIKNRETRIKMSSTQHVIEVRSNRELGSSAIQDYSVSRGLPRYRSMTFLVTTQISLNKISPSELTKRLLYHLIELTIVLLKLLSEGYGSKLSPLKTPE